MKSSSLSLSLPPRPPTPPPPSRKDGLATPRFKVQGRGPLQQNDVIGNGNTVTTMHYHQLVLTLADHDNY